MQKTEKTKLIKRPRKKRLEIGIANYIQSVAGGSAVEGLQFQAISKILDFSSWYSLGKQLLINRSLTTEWFSADEAAEYLGIPVGSLRNMTSNGKIPYYQVPGTRSVRYRQIELRELLLSTRKGA